MPPVLTLAAAHLKGGAGKSTLAQNLGACLQRAGKPSLLVDIDPQGTSRLWGSIAAERHQPGPAVIAMEGKSLQRDLGRVARPFEIVLLDTPPRLGPAQRAAMAVADAVLLPITPGPADVWALRETLDVLAEVRALRPEVRAYALLNRMAPRTTLCSAIRKAVRDADVPLLQAGLGSRVAYPEAMTLGLGVSDYAPRSAAALDVEALVVELWQRLKEAA